MKTSKKDFDTFVRECQKWINFWGLHSWRVAYRHKRLSDNNGEAEWQRSGRVAVIRLAKDVDEKAQVKMTAFHEVDELRYARIRDLANDRTATEDQINEAIHELIRQDENLIYKKCKG
jgi:hypothetical protein